MLAPLLSGRGRQLASSSPASWHSVPQSPASSSHIVESLITCAIIPKVASDTSYLTIVDEKQINQTALLAGVIGQIGCLTVLLIAIALGAGFTLDRILDTRPIFTILFLVGSVPITLYLTVRVSLYAAARAQNSQQDADSENTEDDRAP